MKTSITRTRCKTHWMFPIIIFLWIGFHPAEEGLRAEDAGSSVNYRIEEIGSGLGVVWGLAFENASELIFTVRSGKAGILEISSGSVNWLGGVPAVFSQGQGGLLDVAVPPGYEPGGWIYFTYSNNVDGKGVTTIARARHEGNRLAKWQDLLVTKSETDTDRHFGSRIAFDGSGHLFFTVGERGHRPNAQDLTNHAGKVLRVTLDGEVPADNPFVGQANALPEIWSYGHRNPQGIFFDSRNGRLWINEHGPRGGDEINLVRPGRNYGWPVISYGKEYWGPIRVGEGTHREGMEQPVKVYTPSIAPGSLIVYSGKAFPQWNGDLFSGALAMRHLNRVVLDGSGKPVAEERLLVGLDERIRALAEGPKGLIYLSTDSGRILRMLPDGEEEQQAYDSPNAGG